MLRGEGTKSLKTCCENILRAETCKKFFWQQPVFYRPCKAKSRDSCVRICSICSSRLTWALASCLLEKKHWSLPSLQPQWRQLSKCDSIFLVQHGAPWLHLGLSSKATEGCSHFPFLSFLYSCHKVNVSMPSQSPPSPFLKERRCIFHFNLLMWPVLFYFFIKGSIE